MYINRLCVHGLSGFNLRFFPVSVAWELCFLLPPTCRGCKFLHSFLNAWLALSLASVQWLGLGNI